MPELLQKGIFQERMKELQQAENSIRKLIQNLDAKKDNALQTTFKMVAKHFSDVFKTIVPGGEGKLVMRTKDVQVRSSCCLFFNSDALESSADLASALSFHLVLCYSNNLSAR